MANFFGYYIHQSVWSSLLGRIVLTMKRNVFYILLIYNILCSTVWADEFQAPFRPCWEITSGAGIKIASDNVSDFTGLNISNKNKHLIIYTSEGEFKSLDHRSGQIVWESDFGGEIDTAPFIQNDRMFIISVVRNTSESEKENFDKTETKVLRAVNLLTGITEWEKPFQLRKSFVVSSDSQYINFVTDTSESASYAIFDGSERSFTSGAKANKSRELRKLFEKFPLKAFVESNGNFIWADARGNIFNFDKARSKVEWKMRIGGSVTNLISNKGRLLVTSLDNFLYFIDLTNGNVLWKKRFAGRITEIPKLKGETAVIYLLGEPTLSFISLADGKIFNQISLKEKDFVTGTPILIENLVIFPTNAGLSVYASGNCPVSD